MNYGDDQGLEEDSCTWHAAEVTLENLSKVPLKHLKIEKKSLKIKDHQKSSNLP